MKPIRDISLAVPYTLSPGLHTECYCLRDGLAPG
jgi:hypothetical protein